MKKLFWIIALTGMSNFSQAQLLNKIKQKAKSVVDNAVGGTTGNAGSIGTNSVTASSSSVAGFKKEKASIIFSTTRGGASKTDFAPTDNIYARVLLDQPLKAVLYEQRKENEPFIYMPVKMVYYKDIMDQMSEYGDHLSLKIDKADYDKKYIDLDILPDPKDVKSAYSFGGYKAWIADAMASFENNGVTKPSFGKQEFAVGFGPNSEYMGYFTFTVKSLRENAAVAKRIESVKDAANESLAAATTLPTEFNSAGKFSDPELSLPKIKNMIQYDGMQIIKLVVENIGGSDWNVNKNELDIPTMKVTNKPVWVLYKENGKCFFTKKYFTRNYLGGGKYGPVELATSTADIVAIACENAK